MPGTRGALTNPSPIAPTLPLILPLAPPLYPGELFGARIVALIIEIAWVTVCALYLPISPYISLIEIAWVTVPTR